MIRLTRRYRFSASHRLTSPHLSEERNQEVFGKCNNPYGHGHDYEIEVTVRGPIDTWTGLAVSRERLDRLVDQQILDPMHLRDLNRDVPEFDGSIPTTENLALLIRERLLAAWPERFPEGSPQLDRIRIFETARNIFEVGGEDKG